MGCQAVEDHLRIVQKRAKMKAINVHFDGKTNLVFLLDDIEHMKKFIKFLWEEYTSITAYRV